MHSGEQPDPQAAAADIIASRVGDDRAGEAIAQTIGSLISSGDLAKGAKLPTVRALAKRLEVSANTVAEAWRILQSHGAITTDRRRGTTVRGVRSVLGGRYWQVPVAPGTIELDLSTGTPDPDLLPPLGPVLHRLHGDVAVTSYVDPALIPELETEIRSRWPYEPEAVTVVDGAQDALDRAINEIVRFGDTVVVEDPTFPPVLDMLELAGARIIGVPVDDEGPALEPLTAAMEHDPALVIVQPRAHNPTGVNLSRTRADQLRRLIADRQSLIIEDDHSGVATGVAIHSVGQSLPERVVHIHSFSKSHGPDLRIAAIGGPRQLIDRIVWRRGLGPAWTSRLVQQILLAMLTDAETERLVDEASQTYAERRAMLDAALGERGIGSVKGSGLNMWVPVDDEQRTVVALAAHGIGAAPGSPFRVEPSGEQHIRLSVGLLRPHDAVRVADVIAATSGLERDRRL